ncbi:MAG: UbiA prenyltransferase family protein [Myxococcales bacterium]|nr:UbiA prenyltransferase family protein [Myxococcales bacterium]
MQSPPELAPADLASPSALAGASEARGASAPRFPSRRPPAPSPSIPPSNLVRGLVKTLRPHQWVKNLFVLAPIVFSKDLVVQTSVGPALNLLLTGRAVATMAIFCLLAGAVYTINDLVDVAADRVHPIKRDRPIASGTVPPGVAVGMALVLFGVSLGAAYRLDPLLSLVVLVYLAQNVAYSFRLKKIAWFDVVLIAFGFVLRVLAGGIATGVRVSAYMLACTALLALFLGFGKRRHELMLENAGKQRAALQTYTARSLNLALGVTGTATLATYVAYTLDPVTRAFFNSDHLWLTAPFTAFGIVRFLQLVSGRAGKGRGRLARIAAVRGESPTQEMLRDVPFVLNLVVWVAVVAAVVYKLRPAP